MSDKEKIKQLESQVKNLKARLDNSERLTVNIRSFLAVLVERGVIPFEEAAQHGVGELVKDMNGKVIGITPLSLDDLKQMSDMAMKQQATVAKFRQIKSHFVTHQRAVSELLALTEPLARKNFLSTSDMRFFQDIRRQISELISRGI